MRKRKESGVKEIKTNQPLAFLKSERFCDKHSPKNLGLANKLTVKRLDRPPQNSQASNQTKAIYFPPTLRQESNS